tara:strand:- start:319 stop:804 length:486 start_codon:yes stop_codon:yes gene_type:complete
LNNSQEVLAELLNHLKISANKFAFEIGLNANTAIYHVKNGRNNISPELAKKITKRYPELNYNWLLTGEGEMKKGEAAASEAELKEPGENYENAKFEQLRSDIRSDLNELAAGMARNFKVIADGMQTGLQGQEKILEFVDKLDADKIAKATGNLEEFLKSKS